MKYHKCILLAVWLFTAPCLLPTKAAEFESLVRKDKTTALGKTNVQSSTHPPSSTNGVKAYTRTTSIPGFAIISAGFNN